MVKPSKEDLAPYVYEILKRATWATGAATPSVRRYELERIRSAANAFFTMVESMSIRGKSEWPELLDSVLRFRDNVDCFSDVNCDDEGRYHRAVYSTIDRTVELAKFWILRR